MGCLGALVGLAMAAGGGYFWHSSGDFLWSGVVCVIGVVILLGYLIRFGGAGIFDDIGDMFL